MNETPSTLPATQPHKCTASCPPLALCHPDWAPERDRPEVREGLGLRGLDSEDPAVLACLWRRKKTILPHFFHSPPRQGRNFC